MQKEERIMTQDDLMTALRSVANKGGASPHLEDVEAWVRSLLLAIPAGDKWDSRKLFASIEQAGIKVPTRLLTQVMWRLRDCKALPGCWSYDMTRRFMGNPLVMWNRPPAIDEQIF